MLTLLTRFASIVVFTVSFGFAQETGTVLNGVRLEIGMAKADVLQALKKTGEVQPSDRDVPSDTRPDEWCVKTRELQGRVCDYDLVQFYKDKLVSVFHPISIVNGDDAAALVSKLFSAVQNAEKAGMKLSVHTGVEDESGRVRVRVINLFIGDNTMMGLITREPIGLSSQPSQLELTENLLWSSKEAEQMGHKVR